MNVYDFDETILDGDSELYFFDYVLDNKLISAFKRFKLKIYRFVERKHIIKSKYTRPLIYKLFININDLDNVLIKFWDKYEIYIKDFYIKNHKEDDVVISATPRFLLIEIMKRLNIKYLIATEFDTSKMIFTSNICKCEEKVNRFIELFNKYSVDEFYSDSFSDRFMARLSKHPYKVIKDKIIKWEENEIWKN